MWCSSANIRNVNKCNIIFNIICFILLFYIMELNFAFLLKMNNNYQNICFAEKTANDNDFEEEISGAVNEALDSIDFSGLEDLIDVENSFFGFEEFGFKEYVKMLINGEQVINIENVFNSIKTNLIDNLKNLLKPILLILVVVLLVNVFNNFKSDKVSKVSEIIYFVSFSVIIVILSVLIKDVMAESKSKVLSIQKQMSLVFPIILTLISTMGGVLTVGAYSPMLSFLINIVSSVFIYFLFPLFSLSVILSILGNLSDNLKLDKFNDFIKSLFKWVVGVVFAVFMGFLSIKGLTAGVSDGISVKATKFAIKNYIPMLGGYINEGFEFIKAGSMLVKNATGVVSILLLFLSIISPILMIAMFQLLLRLLSGLVEVFGDKKSSKLIFDISNSLKFLIVILVGVALMYFFTIFLLICSASSLV